MAAWITATLNVDVRTGAIAVYDPHTGDDASMPPRWPSLARWVQDIIVMWESGLVASDDRGAFVPEGAELPPGLHYLSHAW